MQEDPKPEPSVDRATFCKQQSELWESFALSLATIKASDATLTEDQIEALTRASSLCLKEAEEWHARRRRVLGNGNAQPGSVKR